MMVKLNLIAAACENMGIGKNNNLPWRLKTEMEYFTQMTKKTRDANKRNVVIMGRKTWDSIPDKFKPLSERINFVLSRADLNFENYCDVHGFKSLEESLEALEDEKFKNVEIVWIIGGSQIYEEAMKSKHFYRLYLTDIMKSYDCDTFFPKLTDNLEKISDPNVPDGTQEEKGVRFVYNVYQNTDFKEEC